MDSRRTITVASNCAARTILKATRIDSSTTSMSTSLAVCTSPPPNATPAAAAAARCRVPLEKESDALQRSSSGEEVAVVVRRRSRGRRLAKARHDDVHRRDVRSILPLSMDECCVVCADPLEWTAYGPCGHTQTCSKCVARLRFVLKDKRCVICQQETDVVFFTRHAGNFTRKLTPEQFHELQVRPAGTGSDELDAVRQGGREFRHLSVINGYFDDAEHFQSIK